MRPHSARPRAYLPPKALPRPGSIGCIGEVVRHIGRIIMHTYPWNSTNFHHEESTAHRISLIASRRVVPYAQAPHAAL
jgi:hypothetical protein